MRKLLWLAALSLLVQFTPQIVLKKAQAGCNDSPAASVDWENCRKRNLMLGSTDLSGANFRGADLGSTDLRSTKLDGAVFNKTVLLRAAFNDSSAVEANFEKSIGYRTNFGSVDLEGANFQKAEMQRANFKRANLRKVDFSKSEIGRANFDEAVLNNNDFSFANIARASFKNTIVSGVLNFDRAFTFRTQFQGTDLSGAIKLLQWQVDMACGDGATKLPDGLTVPPNWPCPSE